MASRGFVAVSAPPKAISVSQCGMCTQKPPIDLSSGSGNQTLEWLIRISYVLRLEPWSKRRGSPARGSVHTAARMFTTKHEDVTQVDSSKKGLAKDPACRRWTGSSVPVHGPWPRPRLRHTGRCLPSGDWSDNLRAWYRLACPLEHRWPSMVR